jgi:tRNA(Ile)-lysidine synthase
MPFKSLIDMIHAAAPPEGKVALAVSGGGDSIAMLHLAQQILPVEKLVVFHVNHGLRDEAKNEESFVAALCKQYGLAFFSKTLSHLSKEQSNLQAMARSARYRVFMELAEEADVKEVWLAHTKEDVAETFLMRLHKGAGVKGLSAMAAVFERDGLSYARPLLGAKRGELRAYLESKELPWCEDPSNEDESFLRIKMRKFIQHSENNIVNIDSLVASAHSVGRANEALSLWAEQFWKTSVSHETQTPTFQISAFLELPLEIQFRVIDKCVNWGGEPYPPRTEKKQRLIQALSGGAVRRTLGGILFETNQYGCCAISLEKP